MRIDHVALTVRDRERSAAFYARHFGLDRRIHDDPHLLIVGSAAGSLLALSEGRPAAGALPRTNHFGFRAASHAEVHAIRAALADEGVVETEWQDDGVFVRVQVLDPDGYRVEVYAY